MVLGGLLAAAGAGPAMPLPGVAPQGHTGFDPKRDGFGFPNDTVREYLPDALGRMVGHKREKEPDFAHACFLICRATIQFSRFARFEPDQPRLPEAMLYRRLRRLFRIHAWEAPLPQGRRIVIPGYRDLWEFSRENKALLQASIGSWRMTYIRPGNYRMTFPFPRAGQELAKERLIRSLNLGKLQAVYLSHFPRMNHCVVLYAYRPFPNGSVEFLAYDPNYPGRPTWVRYHAASRSFELQPRWYYNEGQVNLMRVYISPFH